MKHFYVVLLCVISCGILIESSPSFRSLLEPSFALDPLATVYAPPSVNTDFDTVKTDLDDYLWPTDAGTKITSAFAEYRTTHFHGGIDIGTNGQTGYKVFSVRDGDVYRIRITPNGYGKMLFVRHADGYYSTYAHLLTFNDSINAAAREEQYRKGTYAIDYYPAPGKLRVSKGDIIAFTGSSGFGPPHLHFELRDENMNPLNPLLCPQYSVRDNIAPAIRRILITPLSYSSTIDNANRSKILSRFPGRKRAYRIPQTLRVHGLIGFGVEAQDHVDGTTSKEGIHRLELFIDDSLAYAMQLDRVPADETKQIDLHYDLPTILHGWGKFQKLYVEKGNVLPFYDKQPAGTGVINTNLLTEGEHGYRIVCQDISGNSTELSGKLFANHQPEISIFRVDDEEITLSGNRLESIEKCYVYGKKNIDHEWTQHTYTRSRMEMDANGIEIPFTKSRYDIIKVVAESRWGSASAPIFHFFKKPNGTPRDVRLAVDVRNDYVVFTVSSTGVFTEAPSLVVQEGDSSRSVSLEAVDLYKYVGIFHPLSSQMGNRIAKVSAEVNGSQTATSELFELYPLTPERKSQASLFNRQVFISCDSGSVYSPLYLQASLDFLRNTPIYVFEPDDVLLNKGIHFSIDPGNDVSSDHLGLYFRSNGGWIFQTSTKDPGMNTFSTTLDRTLGELALLKDAEAPSFGRLRCSAPRGKPYIAFRYHDNLSGVDTDEIKMYIDGALVIPEIDGEHHQVWYQARDPLLRGKHLLKISMKDKMQNISELQRVFSVR